MDMEVEGPFFQEDGSLAKPPSSIAKGFCGSDNSRTALPKADFDWASRKRFLFSRSRKSATDRSEPSEVRPAIGRILCSAEHEVEAATRKD